MIGSWLIAAIDVAYLVAIVVRLQGEHAKDTLGTSPLPWLSLTARPDASSGFTPHGYRPFTLPV